MSKFGQYIKEIRESRGLTITKLAKISDVSSSLISRIENNVRGIPKPDTIEKLSKALSIPYEYLMEKAGYLDKKDNLDNNFAFLKNIDVNILETLKDVDPGLLKNLKGIDPDLLQKFAEIVKSDPYQSLFFDDILSASKEEREEIVREWVELRKNFRKK